MQFYSRLIWTLKVSTVPSNLLMNIQQGQWRSLSEGGNQGGNKWDEHNPKERRESEF